MTRAPIHPGSRAARAFTLVELLTVISIIALLTALVVGASTAIIQRQTANVTQSVVLTLDRALEEYLAVNNGLVPPYVREYFDEVPGKDNTLMADPRNYAQRLLDQDPQAKLHSQRPDASVFIRQVQGQGEVDAILQEIPQRFLVLTPRNPDVAIDTWDPEDLVPSVVDSWADPEWESVSMRSGTPEAQRWPVRGQHLIYYVHPENHLAQAIYGQCINGRPYFVSAGPDGRYGHPTELEDADLGSLPDEDQQQRLRTWREDNIYSAPIDIDFDVNDDVKGAVSGR